ncbi:MAG: hypothetical protein K2O13_08385, partial [Lachnospiraceae bacterium]|nr:hypothetical protein [Lachnospiraceae bacterium]
MKGKRWIGALAGAALLVLSACGAAEQAGESETPENERAATESAGPEEESAVKEGTGPGDETAVKEGAGLEDETADAEDDWPEDDRSATEGTGSEDETAAEDGTGPEEERTVKEMKLSILGDSISTYEGWIPEGNSVFYPHNGAVQDVSQTWWKIVLDETGFVLCTNGSSSGSTCIGDSRAADVKAGCSDLRISQLSGADGEAPDIIIVYMGTNDMIESAQIGDNDGLKPVEEGPVDNFSDAYTLTLDKLKAQYPSAQIYCCTLPPLGNWGTDQPFVTFVNGQG